MLYFKVKTAPNGYPLQMAVNLTDKTIKKGYCLTAFNTCHKLASKSELIALYNDFVVNGFTPLND